MTIKSNVGKPDPGSVLGRTQALAEAVDAAFGPGTSKNVTRHAGTQGATALVSFLKENAPAIREGLERPPAAPAAAQARSTAPATAPATRGPTRKQLEAIVGICSPLASKEIRASWTDAELLLEAERAAFQAYVTFPGRRSDEALSNEFWRKHTNANELTGRDRVFRADRQAAVNQILKGK
jgi:hypothetical protein